MIPLRRKRNTKNTDAQSLKLRFGGNAKGDDDDEYTSTVDNSNYKITFDWLFEITNDGDKYILKSGAPPTLTDMKKYKSPEYNILLSKNTAIGSFTNFMDYLYGLLSYYKFDPSNKTTPYSKDYILYDIKTVDEVTASSEELKKYYFSRILKYYNVNDTKSIELPSGGSRRTAILDTLQFRSIPSKSNDIHLYDDPRMINIRIPLDNDVYENQFESYLFDPEERKIKQNVAFIETFDRLFQISNESTLADIFGFEILNDWFEHI